MGSAMGRIHGILGVVFAMFCVKGRSQDDVDELARGKAMEKILRTP